MMDTLPRWPFGLLAAIGLAMGLLAAPLARAHDTHGWLYEDSEIYLNRASERFRDRLKRQRWRELEHRYELEQQAYERLLWDYRRDDLRGPLPKILPPWR